MIDVYVFLDSVSFLCKH